ncbi:MAG: sugar transferase [Actinomycetota bacterium]|nr:sugar transferase [Actinomycetota bacterium]
MSLRPTQLAAKRAFDVTLATMSLIVLSPFLAVIAVLIKATSRGPVLYRDVRAGRDGRPFEMMKFRTMIDGASQLGLGRMVAKDDWRITRVGRFLRRTTLDEVPQLLNVLKGEMSIVGPRAATPDQMTRCSDRHRRRLEVRPGMAGWAWIHGRNNISWSERMELDLWYVDNWSFSLDLKIVARSFVFLLRGDGIYGPDGVTTDVMPMPAEGAARTIDLERETAPAGSGTIDLTEEEWAPTETGARNAS